MSPRRKSVFTKMEKAGKNKLKQKIFEVVFESNTPYGKIFDVILLVLIIFSVALVMLESVSTINAKYHRTLIICEWAITFMFTAEYFIRLFCVRKPWRYVFSFYGIIDLLSILPTYIGLFHPSSKYLSSIRILRFFRVFRIFGMTRFVKGRNILVIAIKESREKIIVFLSFVILMVVVIGSIIYVLERSNPNTAFTSIPYSIYWAIVTLTTVGYGDMTPSTPMGQFLASVVMIIGYGVIAVPTGIFSMEMNRISKQVIPQNTDVCHNCGDDYHLDASKYCKSCGEKLNPSIKSEN